MLFMVIKHHSCIESDFIVTQYKADRKRGDGNRLDEN